MARITPSEAEEMMTDLETDMRKLRVEYDAYFAGGRKRPPAETEWRVQRTIKQLMERTGRMKYGERFRFNNLANRYAKYSEIWRRRSAKLERGESPFSYSQTARELEQKRLAEAEEEHAVHLGEKPRPKARRVSVGAGDSSKESEHIQELYRAMVETRTRIGEKGQIDYEQFHQFVRQKTQELKRQMGADRVEFTIDVKGGKVNLKAKKGS